MKVKLNSRRFSGLLANQTRELEKSLLKDSLVRDISKRKGKLELHQDGVIKVGNNVSHKLHGPLTVLQAAMAK